MRARPESASAAALLALALSLALPVHAHHSISMFDLAAPTWVKGTVLRYEPVNPHVLITLEERTAGGGTRQWLIEGPILARLARMELAAPFLEAGEAIEVCGFPYRQALVSSARAATSASPPPRLHGHLLVMPDGRMRPWGPYGKLDNCIRAADPVQRWLAFVNADPMGREYWCRAGAFTAVPLLAPPGFRARVDQQMDEPCGQ